MEWRTKGAAKVLEKVVWKNIDTIWELERDGWAR